LQEEFKGHGTRVIALNQRGDDSPEGQLTDGLIDQVAKYERAKIAESTRRGRIKKAREGKIVGTGTPNYGFRYVDGRYEIVEPEMEVVNLIFNLIADGNSVYEVASTLKDRAIRTRRGNLWHRSSIRPLIFNDVYEGTFWYNRFRKSYRTVRQGDRYITKVTSVPNPEESWIAIPVPRHVPLETVERAKDKLLGNRFKTSSNSNRFWELSGGVGFCGNCGRRLTTVAVPSGDKTHLYYRCSNNWSGDCANRKHYRAHTLEDKAIEALKEIMTDDGRLRTLIEGRFDQRIGDLKKRDPRREAEILSGKIALLKSKLSNAQDLCIDGLLSKQALKKRRLISRPKSRLAKRALPA
jgi:site-specific DNA recombinase